MHSLIQAISFLNSNSLNCFKAERQSSSEQSSPREATVMIGLRQQNATSPAAADPATVDPDHEAKMLLKNLASKADYTTISKIVQPILAYLDDNKPTGWEYSKFVRCVFLILMYNVKQQHAIVIKDLIKHLDSHRNSTAQLKCYIIRAISICIRIAAMHSVGTTGQIIEIFTNLLKHLNFSVEKASECRKQLLDKPNQTWVRKIDKFQCCQCFFNDLLCKSMLYYVNLCKIMLNNTKLC